MKYIFVMNPAAGSGSAEKIIHSALRDLDEQVQYETYVTRTQKDATAYVKRWCETHPNEEVRFIACGGDGTINEVFSGTVGFPNVSVTCYPCGSGNDFVKSFGGAEKFLNIPALLHAKTRKIDLLQAGDHYSVNAINFGFDTAVAMSVEEDRKRKGTSSRSAYTRGIIKALFTNMSNKFRIIADGEELLPEGSALLCTLANGQYLGGSFRDAPRAKTDDGLIEVCILREISYLQFMKTIGIYARGDHLDDPSLKDIVIYRQAEKVEVIAPEGFAYSLDGEIIRENHFTVEVRHKILDLAVPE